ncbi:shikimate dehydrogenase [Microbacterium sediminis]|uniref:Shikimate dehydrogenase n=1 Tax=Microbacterium sediminis TaxID=904291 RepID=A0A1B9NGH7_9MICO|nr:shikimate dehydrogenase [Microbacterium sediminis]OCG75698.1 shikimate dehydrogenase [Microbacterium sediminis]QBR74093.1 shikimate dehydrogenase [Microbacterium sediminis]
MLSGTRLEVWGDPIAHSRSPQLHRAAYRALGLDWGFERRRVSADAFDAELAALDPAVRGLAVTMPGKERAFAAAAWRDRRAELTGAVNTLLRSADGGPRGWNTDVGGIILALREARLEAARDVRILGAGSTAASALVALGELGAERVTVIARRPERAAGLVALGERIGVRVAAASFDDAGGAAELTIATLPGGTALPPAQLDRIAGTGGPLFDVAYSPWPSSLAERWEAPAVAGLGMLLHQAVLQVRVFTTGDVDRPLPDEEAVVRAMRAAMGD